MSENVSEVWWVYSTAGMPWAYLRIATFLKSADVDIVIIHNEGPERLGPRVWDDIRDREQWIKVRKIEIPSVAEVEVAIEGAEVEAALRGEWR